ncbi:Beta-1,3-glucan-binding protein [Mytilus coruscus]|uniref:Beta-1,3-glucan-binding protein n=1 Tax=Mytilus coruscus TaxID=42192 RepID=A0A6J8C9V9_MYTCO|nr:Beta-1,3-glucan-binding protein [Mytilus coruscus]
MKYVQKALIETVFCNYEPLLSNVKIEVQTERQHFYEEFAQRIGDGVWELPITELKVNSGEDLRYRITAYYKDDIQVTEWRTYKLEGLRPVRSMKRAVVFRDDFKTFNKKDYKIDCTAWGGGTLTVDHKDFNTNRLFNGRMNLKEMYGYCTMADNWGCDRTAVNGNVLNPIMSGKVTTKAAIKYGTVTVRAIIPKGDWLWPAIWMLPRDWHYGGWPRSGEIDIMESRGNQKAVCGGNNHGIGEVSSTLHWGPSSNHNAYGKTHGERDKTDGGDWHGWHTYKLEWDANHIRTTVDGHEVLKVTTPSGGFWNWGGFGGSNIWASGGRNAPFDQPFQLILNVAVGGGFFSSGCQYDHTRPWSNSSPRKEREFWDHRGEWLPTWHGDNAAMQIDYIEMVQA